MRLAWHAMKAIQADEITLDASRGSDPQDNLKDPPGVLL
jgi:hypothetical protein